MIRATVVVAAGDWKGEPADSVVLDYDERYRRRFAMTGVKGLAFLLDLEEAAMLRGGDGLKLEDGRIVEVVAAPEPLSEIRAADAAAMHRLAWHLGNRHLPTELLAKGLRIRRDSVIEEMARGLGAKVVELEAPFNPEGGAYVRASAPAGDAEADHVHGPDCDHDHDHGHDHAHEPHDHEHGGRHVDPHAMDFHKHDHHAHDIRGGQTHGHTQHGHDNHGRGKR